MNLSIVFLREYISKRPNLKKVIANIGWLFLDKILRIGVSLLVVVWIARYLGPEQFGILNFATAIIGIFATLAGLGLQSIVVRDIVNDPSCKDETLGTAFALQMMGGFMAYGCLMGAIYLIRPEDNLSKTLVAIMGSSILFKFSEVAQYWFESQVKSKYVLFVQNPCFLVFAGIKLCLVISQDTLTAFAWVTFAEAFFMSLLMLVMFSMKAPKLQKLSLSISRAKKLMILSLPLVFSAVVNGIYMKIDQIMLGQMLDTKTVGVYTAAVRISEVIHFIPALIVASVFPSILEARRLNEAQYQKKFQQLYDLMVWLSVLIALPMTFLSMTVVVYLFGPIYAESGAVLAIHIWTLVFVFLGIASGNWFIAENRPLLSLQRTILGLVINIIFNFILIPKYGAKGAATATLLGQIAAGWLFDIVQPITRPVFFAKTRAFNLVRSFKEF